MTTETTDAALVAQIRLIADWTDSDDPDRDRLNEAAARIEARGKEVGDAYAYARRLAEHLWQAHWRVVAPEWQPLPDLMGVLTQLDNMASGLVRPDTLGGSDAKG